jgi:hypothetical protein
MSEFAKLTSIPNFISAESPQGLRRLMLRTNVRLGTRLVWHSIQFVDGKWFAWFYEDESLERTPQLDNGTGEVIL